MTDSVNMIAFQGAPGAYSDLACRTAFPDVATLPCDTFEDTFAAVRKALAEHPEHFDPRDWLKPAREALYQLIKGKMRIVQYERKWQ